MKITLKMLHELVESGMITAEKALETELQIYEEVLMQNEIKIPTITQCKDGRFCCNVPREYVGGKRTQIKAKTEEECIYKFKKKIYELMSQQEQKNTSESMTFNDLCMKFLYAKRGAIADTTLGQYYTTYKNHILPSDFGQKTLDEIRQPECENLIKSLYKKELSLGTMKNIKKVVVGALRYGVAHDYIRANYMDGVSINANLCSTKKVSKKEAWSDEELQALWITSIYQWKTKRKYRNSAIPLLLATTGVRVGELLALTWDDVDFHNKTLTVDKNYTAYKDIDTEKRIKTMHNGKTSNSRRVIELTDDAIFWFKELKKRNLQVGIPSNRVIATRTGYIMEQAHVCGSIETFCNVSGVPYKPTHAGRRTYASILNEAGVPLREISNDLGHKDCSTTLNCYVKRRNNEDDLLRQKNAAFLATLGNMSKIG